MGFFQYGGLVEQINVTATAAGTTTLVSNTISSATLGKQIQVFTGSSTQTIKLFSATTSSVGAKVELVNQSSGLVTVRFQDGTSFTDASGFSYSSLLPNTSIICKVQTNGTANGTWLVEAGTVPSSSGPGTSGQVLTSNGGSALPSFQVAPTSATGNYYSGHIASSAASWSSTSTSFVDPTISGANTLTQDIANGITVTAGASNVPGVTWSPSSTTATYLISANLNFDTAGADAGALRLYDGTTVIKAMGYQGTSATGGPIGPIVVSGIYKPGTTSAVTIKIQTLIQGGSTAHIREQSGVSGVAVVSFTIVQITP